MSLGQIVLLVYAVLILAGGAIGYRAGSRASLVAGSVSGVLLLLALAWSFRDAAVGLGAGAAVAVLLCVSFGMRLAKTRKVMPSGMLLALSVAAAALLAVSAAGVVG